MSTARTDLAALRRKLAATGAGFSPGATAFSLGAPAIDAVAAKSLVRGGVHEVFAHTVRDLTASAGFGIALALRAAEKRPILWVRQDMLDIEGGALYAPGLNEFGLDPSRLILVRSRDAAAVLRAGEEAARCPPLGAVIVEPWGAPKVLDLTASRRLALAAERSRVTLIMLRAGAGPAPSAATTRWEVSAAPSLPLEADAPGAPMFSIALQRARNGAIGGPWIVEWDRDRQTFNEAAVSRHMVPLPSGEPSGETWRDAG